MKPSRNTTKTDAKSTFLRFQHYSTFAFLIRKTCLKPPGIYLKNGCNNASHKCSKNIQNWSKNCQKSIRNRSEIDAKMMIGSKMAFWKHLGGLGSHLGAQKVGRDFPSCEQRAGPTAKLGAKGPQGTPKASKMVPKWDQNGVQNRSKNGSDSECSKKSISY